MPDLQQQLLARLDQTDPRHRNRISQTRRTNQNLTTKAAKRAIKAIDPEILAILRTIQWTDGIARIVTKLQPNTYKNVNKVLEALGGKWNRKTQGHLFEGDGETLVRESIATGLYLDAKTAFQSFETPPGLAAELVGTAESVYIGFRVHREKPGRFSSADIRTIRKEAIILEPSCGSGNLIQAAIDHAGEGYNEQNIRGIDTNSKALVACRNRFPQADLYCQDFLLTTPDCGGDRFMADLIIMNPPFSQLDDVRHVLHAMPFLKPDGVLISIMSPAWTYRKHPLVDQFNRVCSDYYTSWSLLPDNSFAEAGTGVRCGVLTLTHNK